MPSLRDGLLRYALETYGTEPEYPWASAPDSFVLRRADNKKWYALVMDVPYARLGLPGDGRADILNIKLDPILIGSLRLQPGFLPAYHMHRGNWITVLLDGAVALAEITPLLDLSYTAAGGKTAPPPAGRNWLVPANPRYFDLQKGIEQAPDGLFLWKQSGKVSVGDTVYLYVAAPFSAIRYKCEAVEVDIPYRSKNPHVKLSRVMRLKLLRVYDGPPIGLELLRAHGVYAVRGPRGIPRSLLEEIEHLYGE